MTLKLLEQIRCEKSLHTFFKQAWPYMEGGNPFIDNWHVQAICEHLEAVYRRDIKKLLINVPPRTGKPVYEEMLVLKENGERVPVKDIVEGDLILTHKGRFRRVLKVYKQGILPTVKITTYDRRELITALDHLFLTPHGWVEAGNLNINDILGNPVCKEIKQDSLICAEEARLMGYFIGDGCATGTSANITAIDLVEIEDISKCAMSLGFIPTVQKYNSCARVNLKKGEKSVRDWLKIHQIHNKNSYTKRVPKSIFTSSHYVVANFIGAYFSCDGCVSYKGKTRSGILRPDISIEFDSVNELLLQDIQHLLLRFGIKSRIRKKVRNQKTAKQGDQYTSYNLSFADQDNADRFIKNIPIFHSKRKTTLKAKIERKRFDEDILPDKILSIEKWEELPCRCFEIEEDSSFTINDVAVHNSSLVSCAFPTWVWLHNSEEKFLFASYAAALSLEHSIKCRRLIESPWYQELWPHVSLANDQNAKGYFQNINGGYRIATSVGGSVTGAGGSILILDDGNSADDGASDAKRETANTWRSQVWSTRLNNPKEDCEIVIQQRVHEQDISGTILEKDEGNDWVKLILPNEFDESRKCRTVINGKVWQDPRTKQGELLCEARIGLKETKNLKRQLGSYGYAGQYQQIPSPPEGAIFKKSWFKWWKHQELPEFDGLVQSWDTAYTTKATSDYSACTTWGLFTDQHRRMNVMLLSYWRGKLTYEDLRKMAKNLYFDYRHRTLERDPKLKGKPINICLIEATGFGDQLLYDFSQAGIAAIPFVPNKYGDKTLRAQLVAPIVESGLIWLRAHPPSFTELTMESQEFVDFAAKFPKADSRDVIDTMTQAFIYLKQGVTLKITQDEDDGVKSIRKPPPVY